jgi:2-polyprenyl-6-methoxyphenol hydroxylase-like FAD-dependent oxidoreductase
MVNRTVLISGAGIGGPALAFWLQRHGFAPTVVEVAPAPRPGGHAVDLRGAGREVAGRMGLLDAIRAERVDERGFAYVDRRGRWTARMPAGLFDGEGMVAEIEIMRGNLTRILYDATRDGTEYSSMTGSPGWLRTGTASR